MATVLVVDDEFGVAQVLKDILSEENYVVLTAVNGRQALERLSMNRVDLVLTDYMMPGLDGPGLFLAMAANEVLRSIPVVVMSSLPRSQIADNITGFAAFLRKPFRVDTVLEIVAHTLAVQQHKR